MNEFKIQRNITLIVDSGYQGYHKMHKKQFYQQKERKRKNYQKKQNHKIVELPRKELLLNTFLHR